MEEQDELVYQNLQLDGQSGIFVQDLTCHSSFLRRLALPLVSVHEKHNIGQYEIHGGEKFPHVDHGFREFNK